MKTDYYEVSTSIFAKLNCTKFDCYEDAVNHGKSKFNSFNIISHEFNGFTYVVARYSNINGLSFHPLTK